MSAVVLARASLRFARGSVGQVGLALCGIAIGVALVVAIDVAMESARRAFQMSREIVSGVATHRVLGGPSGVDERVFTVIYTALPTAVATPRVAGQVRFTGLGGSDPAAASSRVTTASVAGGWLRVLGVDLYSAPAFGNSITALGLGPGGGRAGLMSDLLTVPGATVVSAATAARLAVAVGDEFWVGARSGPVRLQVVEVLEPSPDGGSVFDGTLLMDVSTAQETLSMQGMLSSIDLILSDDVARQILEPALPAGLRLEAAEANRRAMVEMTRAFDLNLRMLALLALVIGTFLIYNTISFSVVRRRHQFAVIRALGVTRRQLLVLVLVEASALGAIGAVVGVVLGIGLADALLAMVSRTINDLYFVVQVNSVHVSPAAVLTGIAAGVLAAVVAAVLPAWEASGVSPARVMVRSILESQVRSAVGPAAVAGGALLAVSAWLLFGLPAASPTSADRGLTGAFAALFALVAGAGLLAPGATVLVLRTLQRVQGSRCARALPGPWMAVGRIAAAGALASLSRTALAVAALMIALSATIGVGIMVDSFRSSVARWLDRTLQADIYVGGPGSAEQRSVPPELVRQVRAMPEVAAVSLGRRVTIQSAAGPLSVLVLEMAPKSYQALDILGPAGTSGAVGQRLRGALWRKFDTGGAVLVTEPFASRFGAIAGDTLALYTPAGLVRFPIAGVYRDYASERGSILMSRTTYLRNWNDQRITGMGIYLRPPGQDYRRETSQADLAPASRVTVKSRVESLLPADGQLRAASNGSIKVQSMAVFDRTFTVTQVLRLLAVVVAFFGIVSALLAMQMERLRHFATLRAAGVTRRQLFAIIELETGLLGLIAGLLSIPLGVVLAYALVTVINKRSFGWSMEFQVDPGLLVSAAGLAIVAALLAGLAPAWTMARRRPAEGLRGE